MNLNLDDDTIKFLHQDMLRRHREEEAQVAKSKNQAKADALMGMVYTTTGSILRSASYGGGGWPDDVFIHGIDNFLVQSPLIDGLEVEVTLKVIGYNP